MLNNLLVTKKKVVWDRIKVRSARGHEEKNSVIVSIPKSVVKEANLVIGEYLRIYTDGNKICMERESAPEIS